VKLPPKQVCQLCPYGDDEVMITVTPDGEAWHYVCTSPAHDEPWAWDSKIEAQGLGREGICEELGLYDDLLLCVHGGEPWVEYGIVEHRYKELRPDVYFGELLTRYGHRMQGGRRFTLSALLAKVLGQLGREGLLSGRFGKATGYWSYNGQVSYWAPVPSPPVEDQLTWVDFAIAEGIAPDDWSITPP
jgi:hypothetical protein